MYIITAFDKPNSLDLRLKTREAHLNYIKQTHKNFKLIWGGPILNENQEMIGSHLICQAESLNDVHEFCNNDPYKLAGLFADTHINLWKKTIDNL